MLELWGMQSIPSLPLLPGPLLPGMVVPDKRPIYGLNRTNLYTYAKLNYMKENRFDILMVYGQKLYYTKLSWLN